jgi:hypothetical protein
MQTINPHKLLMDYVEEAKPVQERVYRTFLMLRQFLMDHNLLFVGTAGTMLGAVMYHDFIAWDDDMDFAVSDQTINYLKSLIDPDPHKFLTDVFGNTGVRTQYLNNMGILQFLPPGGGSIDLINYGTPKELAFIQNNITIPFRDTEILIPKNYMGFITKSYINVLDSAYIKNHRRFRKKPAPEFYMSWERVNHYLKKHFTDQFTSQLKKDSTHTYTHKHEHKHEHEHDKKKSKQHQ